MLEGIVIRESRLEEEKVKRFAERTKKLWAVGLSHLQHHKQP